MLRASVCVCVCVCAVAYSQRRRKTFLFPEVGESRMHLPTIVSPCLFTLYSEQVMRKAELEEFGVRSRGQMITDMRYADDTLLIVEGGKNPSDALKKLDNAGKKRCLTLNSKKTKAMLTGRRLIILTVEINGEEIGTVSKFKYLGSVKTENGDCCPDIKAHIAMGKKRMRDLTPIWKDRGVRKAVKLRIIRALVWPVITCGSEARTIKKSRC
uniref:Reverse transcriptase domain-containing protein n=1 Tax=Salarias fasciatus TaxID=181472 RepID=A0A672J9D7_SALFA